jgi:hypothetical protein
MIRRPASILLLCLGALPLFADGEAEAPTPVIVELFTSEGCSSCPMADSLLGSLQLTQPIDGVQVVGLSQHVDYWDGLGWEDPFASPQFTERQRIYTRKFANNSTYTPQMVVAGHEELSGSDRRGTIRAITRSAAEPRASISVLPLSGEDGSLTLGVRIADLPEELAAADVMLALTEGKLATKVEAGENVGRKLRHESVVRELRAIGELEPSASAPEAIETKIELSPDWKRENLRAVVFIQERESLRIRGAGLTSLAGEPATSKD